MGWFIPALMAGGASLAGNLYSQNQSAKLGQQMENLINKRQSDLSGWFNKSYHQDFMNTDMAKSITGKLRSQFDDATKNFRANAVKTGATVEANTAGKGELQKRYAEALNNLMGYGTQYKENIRRDYQNRLGYLDQLRMNMLQNRQQGYANMGNNISGTVGNLASAFMMGG